MLTYLLFCSPHPREGGTRVNSFASGGVIPAAARGTHYHGLLALVDWFPTVCHLAGITTIKSNLTAGSSSNPRPSNGVLTLSCCIA